MSEGVDSDEALDWVLDKLSAAKKAPKAQSQPLKVDAGKTVKDLTSKKKTELELYHQWNNSGRKPEHLDLLLKSFAPMIQARVNTFKRTEVPLAAIEFEHKKAFVRALETWDPNKGGALPTWVTTNLRKVGRYIGERQNFARITENVSKNIGVFNAVKSELTEKLGYEPDSQALHDHVVAIGHPKLGGLSLRDIKRLNEDQRKGRIMKGYETEDINLSPDPESAREWEVIHLIQHDLTPQERSVHELTFGLNGNSALSPGQIAKRLKMDNSKVAKLRTSIFKKMEPYLPR